MTAKLPAQAGVACPFTPKKRWPGASTLSCRLLPMRTASACPCSLAIRAPAEAVATGRLAFPCAEPLTPRGSQISSECGLEVISRSSPGSRSTPVSVQGWVVEMVKEYSLAAGAAPTPDCPGAPRTVNNPSKRANPLVAKKEVFIANSRLDAVGLDRRPKIVPIITPRSRISPDTPKGATIRFLCLSHLVF